MSADDFTTCDHPDHDHASLEEARACVREGRPSREPRSKSPEDTIDWLASLPSDQMAFEITRDPTPGQSFSTEGLNEFHNAISSFIGSRILAHWPRDGEALDTSKPGASRLRVDVRVTVDGESVAPEPGEEPWFKVDGTHRAAGRLN